MTTALSSATIRALREVVACLTGGRGSIACLYDGLARRKADIRRRRWRKVPFRRRLAFEHGLDAHLPIGRRRHFAWDRALRA